MDVNRVYELIIKFVIAILFFGALTSLIFAMFKLPIRTNDKQLVTFAVVIGSVNFYFKFIVMSPYVFGFQIITCIILLITLRRYPILYAIIVSIMGFLGVSLIDGVVSLTTNTLQIFTVDQMINDFKTYVILHLVIMVLYIIIACLLVRYKIGFSFVKRRFSGAVRISSLNYIWAVLLIIAMIIMTVLTQPAVIHTLNMYIILVVSLIFIASVWYAYRQNKISLKDRYGGTTNLDKS